MITTRQARPATYAHWAALLLLILAGHLALMASPLHGLPAPLAAGGRAHTGTALHAPPSPTGSPLAPVPDRHEAVHCRLQVAPPAPGAALLLLASLALAPWAQPPLGQADPPPPLAHAPGPPGRADTQALLQIFRI